MTFGTATHWNRHRVVTGEQQRSKQYLRNV